ncbi:MAG: toll/interleukin-1 receptor domain-containing protein [Vallitaleaceae bacterium]|jgi:hypothetical protein|nr:toll/interleukin-1 receptor domain-containing protein [Vallitaleaceae bacterium]
MIFLSHNHKDKAIVEHIAIKLTEVFSQDQIFYDSWSMQPGDGIIDKMNEGLGDCKLFLFFVSKNSLQSNMVKLEWQNALIKATRGETKIIPVKLDDCLMPPILLQSIYIDLFSNGLDVAVRQIVDVVSGRNTYQKGYQEFSNLKAYATRSDSKVTVECCAEHYLEPISHFLFVVSNSESELKFNLTSHQLANMGFNKDISMDNGKKYNAQLIAVEQSTTPGFPMVVEIEENNDSKLDLVFVMHEKKRGDWSSIPLVFR